MTSSRYRGNPEALGALVQPDRVHRDLYISQEVFELEQEHFFAKRRPEGPAHGEVMPLAILQGPTVVVVEDSGSFEERVGRTEILTHVDHCPRTRAMRP